MTASKIASALTAAYPPMLQADGLGCRRGGRLLFGALTLSLQRGDLLQVAGPNGCGKTTLLRILCGLRSPDDGTVRWQGTDIPEVQEEFRSELLFIGFQSGLKLELSPRENLRYLASVGSGAMLDIDDALEIVGLKPWADTPCRQLSAGQIRRAALARLQLQARQLWILDEPFTGLDQQTRSRVEALIFSHADAGGSVVFTTHHPLGGQHRGLRLLELGT